MSILTKLLLLKLKLRSWLFELFIDFLNDFLIEDLEAYDLSLDFMEN
jgi:hypothetical protein